MTLGPGRPRLDLVRGADAGFAVAGSALAESVVAGSAIAESAVCRFAAYPSVAGRSWGPVSSGVHKYLDWTLTDNGRPLRVGPAIDLVGGGKLPSRPLRTDS